MKHRKHFNETHVLDPKGTSGPYFFGVRDNNRPEGSVSHVQRILDLFEPIDVLAGASRDWFCDSQGIALEFRISDESHIRRNEYPPMYAGITCEIIRDSSGTPRMVDYDRSASVERLDA